MQALKTSRLRLGILLGIALLLAACGQTREMRIEMEVTRVVTQQVEVTRLVVVTATPFGLTPENTVAPSATHTETPEQTLETDAATSAGEVAAFPTPVQADVIVAEQEFQNGRMYYLQPRGEIWVLVYDDESAISGRWSFFEDTWEEGQPESDPNLASTMPEGLEQPIRGFGKLWRENSAIQEALGWALDSEYGYWTSYQYVFGGTMDEGTYVPGAGEHFFTAKDGSLLTFYEDDGTWERTLPQSESTEEATETN